MIDGRTRGSAAAHNIHGRGAPVRRIKFPDLKISLKDDRLSVVTNARPQDAAVFELRHLPRLAVDIPGPDVLGATAIGNVKDGAIIFAPHRPGFFGVTFADLFVVGV